MSLPGQAGQAADRPTPAEIAAARRPAWLDLALAVVLGTAIGLLSTRIGPAVVAGIVVGVVGGLAVLLAGLPNHRRRGQLQDRRGKRSRFVAGMVCVLPVAVVHAFGPTRWQPWFSLLGGLVVAVVVFAALRWEDREHARRLTRGDYDSDALR